MVSWKPIPGYPDYHVSGVGDVKSFRYGKDRLLSPGSNKGYPQVILSADGVRTTCTIHKLVMLSFVGPRPDGMQIRHLNGVRSDNHLENLKYGTSKENHADTVLHGHNHYLNKTHCPSGHPYDLENTQIRKMPSGREGRHCVACRRLASLIFRSKQKKKTKICPFTSKRDKGDK